MTVQWLDADAVHSRVPAARARAAMVDTLIAVADGAVIAPQRLVCELPSEFGLLAAMPGFVPPRTVGAKLLNVRHQNRAMGLPGHQGVVVLFDADTGAVRAFLDAQAVTALRTAAVTAAATQALARPEAQRVLIVGAGEQALYHVRALAAWRPEASFAVWSRTPASAQRLLETAGVGCAITVADDLRRSAAEADIICTVTSSAEPVLAGDMLRPGVHINAVGAARPNVRELDATAVARCTRFVEQTSAARSEAGDLLLAVSDGAIARDLAVVEIGEVLARRHPGRSATTQITLFKSVGLAVEDLALAELALAAA